MIIVAEAVFLESSYTLLVIIHLISTILLVGAMTHNLIWVIGYLKGKFNRQVLEARCATVTFWSYLLVYISGALMYPAFRIHMREEYFDKTLPWATGLFEIKEHLGAITLALLAGYWILRKTFKPSEDKSMLWMYVPLCLIINVVVWYKLIAGAYLTMLKGAI